MQGFKKKLFVAVVASACVFAAPSVAMAADINNSVSSSATSVKVGKTVTVTQKSVYAWWHLGPVGIPFMSDFRTEIPCAYFSKPADTSAVGVTASWKKVSKGQYNSSAVWVKQSSASWFTGSTTWMAKSKTTAKAKKSGVKIQHGQSGSAKCSYGPTAYCKVTSK